MKVKICGLTRKEDVELAASLGAWALGFIFYKKSPRYVDPKQVKQLIEGVSPFIKTVGVFVNSSVKEINDFVNASGVKAVQLHGDESPEFCKQINFEKIKAVQVESVFDQYTDSLLLLDSRTKEQYGGTGQTVDWHKASQIARSRDIILSGGLVVENVRKAVGIVAPFAVDVSSGVESRPGVKDPAKMNGFFREVLNL